MARGQRRLPIRDPSVLERLSPRTREARGRALEALSWMRSEGLSLRQAARQADTTPGNVRRWTDARVLRKEGRRWRSSSYDTLARFEPVVDPGTGEVQAVAVGSSRDASRLGQYWTSVRRWRQGETPEEAGLTGFEGASIELADGTRLELVTDRLLLDELDAQGQLDALAFES